MAERSTVNRMVAGSNPAGPANKNTGEIMPKNNSVDIEQCYENQLDLEDEISALKKQNEKMQAVLDLILEVDALQDWAHENPDGDKSIADLVRELVTL